MDKNKIIEAAAKLVAKGAYDKAIKEYQKILEVDAKDVRILQKMGELYQKKNDNSQAAIYFTKVAESYANDGFFLKAVALYKQVLKLDPALMDVNIKLAELHQQLQLMSEAMAYYQIVANHYDKAGDVRKSLDVLKTMVDLDPDNVPSRVKLADLYLREQMQAEATSEFQRAAEHLKRQGSVDDYLRVAERISAIEPNNLVLARELAEIYLQKNDQKRALAKLQICFRADPRDIDTLRLLAVAFQGLGQTSKTVSVYKELARAYEGRNQLDDAEKVWQQVSVLDPTDPDVQARNTATAPPQAYVPPAPPMSSPVPQRAPAAAQAPAPAAPALERPKVDNIAKLLTETDVYVKYGLHDKALEHLRKIFATDPENIDAHEKAYAIYVASNNTGQAFEQLLNVLRLHTRRADAQRAQPYLAAILQQNPGHAEVPAFLATLRMAGPAPVSSPSGRHEITEDAILVDSVDDEVIVADEHEEVLSAELEVEEPGFEAAEVISEDEPHEEPDAPQSYEALSDEGEAEVVSEFEAPEHVTTMAGDEGYEELMTTGETEALVDEPSFVDLPAAAPEYAPWGELGGDEEQSTEGRGLQAPAGIPLTTTPMYRGQAAQLEPEALYEQEEVFDAPTRVGVPLDKRQAPTASTTQFQSHDFEPEPVVETYDSEPVAEEVIEEPYEQQVEAPPEEEPASEECDEATFFLEQGLLDEAREILETVLIAYPEHQRAATLMAQLEAGVSGQALGSDMPQTTTGRDAFDLAAELANELGDMSDAPSPSAPSPEEYQVSVDEVFSEFKKGIEKVVKPEDVETHYDLGIAYKEMGLIEDAVSEFTVARKGCMGKRKEIDCLSMIGILQAMKGDYATAIDAYQQALATEHATGDVEKAARYELAGLFESAGSTGRALSQYMRVEAIDNGYREVARHVERLAAMTEPEEEVAPPTANRRKVGYV